MHVSLSSEVLPRIREWPRLSTTLLNAYLEPVLVHYIDHLNRGLDGSASRIAAALPDAVERRRHAVLGRDRRRPHGAYAVLRPAAGAQASAYLATDDARRGLVTLDMGGTSADIAFIEGGVPLEVTEGDRSRAARSTCRARHDDDLGRRRLDRLDRRRRLPHCRPAERRRRSRPGLLRPRRHAPDRDRCRPRLRLSQSRLFPRRRADARCRRRRAPRSKRRSPSR